ncbi:MAG: response regulator transcription factor [Anaerolineae bacterium]|nr:response regulator transcription factor [Anaerolineae bacterium]
MVITIVLADDHAIVRDGLRSLLETNENLRVIGDADNGRDALHLVSQNCPDVAILDIAMPEMNGIEATRQIIDTCPDIKVIILSMHATSRHIYRALQAGARGYLLKASAGFEVVDAIQAVYKGQRYLSQKISDIIIEDYITQRETEEVESPLTRLSSREREILQLVVEGKSSSDIAGLLSLSSSTVDTYRSRLMQKLDINDIPSLVKFAIRHGITSLE